MEIKNRFLNLFFKKSEEVCVSNSKYGQMSVNVDSVLKNETIELTSCGTKQYTNTVDIKTLNLCAINPIKGSRCDKNVTAFRSFLVEIDDGDFNTQFKYIKAMKMPYSICTFSGNKSLHFGIVLEEDLPSIEYWRFICQWILNVMEFADQQTKNPSRSIRFPNMVRENGNVQSIVDMKNRVNIGDLLDWLEKYPEKKPKKRKKVEYNPLDVSFNDFKSVPKFISDKLADGIFSDRNKEWFNVSCVLARRLWEEDEAVGYLSNFFVAEEDFSEQEWLICIKSAFKTVKGE